MNLRTLTRTWRAVVHYDGYWHCFYGYSCECPRGFDGMRCQQLSHSFSGAGWAWYPPLAGCEDDTLSVEFATTQRDGLILFNGECVSDKYSATSIL